MRSIGFDGHTLPYEKPENRTWLQERLERRQVSLLDYIMTPDDSWGCALTLTSGARMLFWSATDRAWESGQSPYRFRIVLRWMPPHKIWTGRMGRYFGRGRDSGLATAVTPHLGADVPIEAPDDVQRRVEGEYIVGASPTYRPNRDAGEQIVLEFRGGGRLRLDALLPRPGQRTCRVDMGVEWVPPPEVSRVWMPGIQA